MDMKIKRKIKSTKNIKILFLTGFILLISSGVFANNLVLTDIEDHWASEDIKLLINESIVHGYEDGTFKPNNNVSVSEFLKIIIEMADYKLETQGERWPNWYIQTAIKNNLISEKEYEDYSRYITRFEAAKIISQYIKLDDVSKNRNIFKDLSNDEKDIILKLVKLKVISGYSDNTFRSDNLLTRAEACKIIINAYNEKQELMKTRKGELVSSHTNIKDADNANIDNTYQIKNNRIYIYDLGRYAKLNGQTLNQEYIKDRIVINLLKNLVSEESYVELKFVPDKYIINNLNICYGNTKNEVQNGNYIFEIRFYENSYYNVAVSKDNEEFMSDACIKIKTGKMWNKKFECETDISCSEKNLFKLKQAVGIIIDKEIEDEFIKYFIEKRIEASKIPNSDEPKISEVKKIGEYTINTFCINNNDLEFYIKKF